MGHKIQVQVQKRAATDFSAGLGVPRPRRRDSMSAATAPKHC